MPRIEDVLERESRTVDLEQGDFERLLGRRERKQRNRRIRAGVVGVAVALVMGLAFVRSLTSDGIPADPPVQPTPAPAPAAPGTLAYELDGDIYVADPDGSNAVKIANGLPDGKDCADHPDGGTYGAEGPMWSPDGRYIAFRYGDCSNPEIGGVISDAEGNVLATFPREGWEIAWSPDSTLVAVWDVTFETIGVYGLDGARQAQLTMPPGWTPSGDHDPKWMPDGTSVWVENWELPLDGSAPRELPARGGDPYATYSPDGSLVAYSTNGSLTVARSDGSEPREVFDEGSYGADWGHPWSATGDRIAFATSGRGSAWWSAELRVVDVATGSVTLLTEGERGVSLHAIGFSPRGDRILFRKDEGRANSLWSIGVDGSDARLVVAGTWQGEWFVPWEGPADIPADPPVEPQPEADPSDQPAPEPAQGGAGEVLDVMNMDLVAQDTGSGAVRTIVDADALPGGCSQECSFGDSEAITGAAWSPDRRWVAFRAGGLWVADTIGGAPRQLTADQGWFPWVWSPTEDRLAFVQGDDVALVDAATGRETDLGTVSGPEDGEGYAVHDLVWSPDGTRIAYDGGPGWGSVYSIDVESGEHSLLVRQPSGAGEIIDIDWSPDGAHMAIRYEDRSSTALYLANADGSNLRFLTALAEGQWSVWHPGSSVGTAWSPDGTRFAYTTLPGSGDEDPQLWTVSMDGSAPSLVLSRCCLVGLGGPVWSPDGARIGVETEPPGDQTHEFLLVNANGTGEPTEIDELTYRSWLEGWYFCRCYG